MSFNLLQQEDGKKVQPWTWW